MDGKSPQVRIGLRNAFTGRMFFSGVFLSVGKTTSLERLRSKERLGSLFFYVHAAPLVTQPKYKNLFYFLKLFFALKACGTGTVKGMVRRSSNPQQIIHLLGAFDHIHMLICA